MCQRGPLSKTVAVGTCYGTQLQIQRKSLCNSATCCHFAYVRNVSFCPRSFPSLLHTSPGLASCPDWQGISFIESQPCYQQVWDLRTNLGSCLGMQTEERFGGSFFPGSNEFPRSCYESIYTYLIDMHFTTCIFEILALNFWPGKHLWTYFDIPWMCHNYYSVRGLYLSLVIAQMLKVTIAETLNFCHNSELTD